MSSEALPYRAPRGLFRKRRPLRRTAIVLLDLVVLVALLALGGLAVGPHLAGYRTLTMLTASMRPHFPAGSIVVVSESPTSSLRAGDVITFNAPTPDRPVVTHRVVSVDHSGTASRVVTKGDANNADDSWGKFAIEEDTVWLARGAVPYAGYAVAALRNPRAQLALVWVLPGVLLAWLLISVWRPDDAAA